MDADLEKNQVVQYGNYILDSQTIAKKLGKHHKIAKTSHKQNWLRTRGAHFNYNNFCMMLTRKHNKHIQDAEDREEMIKQELWDFMDDYKVGNQNRAN